MAEGPATEPLVVLRDVRFAYGGEGRHEVLNGVTMDVPAGESLAVLGASGSGKSTLLSLIGLLNPPDSGELRFEGRAIETLSEVERCRVRAARVGFVFQHHFLLPELTALENVALPGRLAAALSVGPARTARELMAHAERLLERLGLSERRKAYPRQLSGGEQQRAAIARALMNEPALVLADEPTGNLDSASGAKVLDLLGELQREHGTTLVVVTHDATVAGACHRRVTMRDGTVAA